MKHYLCRMSILESSCITFPCLKLVGSRIHLANCTPLIPSDSGNLTSPKLFHQLTPPVNMNLQTDSNFQLFKWLCHFTLNVTIIYKRCYCPCVGRKIECKLFQYLKKSSPVIRFGVQDVLRKIIIRSTWQDYLQEDKLTP